MSEKTAKKPFGFLRWAAPAVLTIGVLLELFGESTTWVTFQKLWPLWLILGLTGATLYLLHRTGKPVKQIAEEWPVVKKLMTGLMIGAVLIVFGFLLHYFVSNYLVTRLGIESRKVWMLIAALTPFFLAGFWTLFQEILPSRPGSVFWGQALLSGALIGLIFFTYHERPFIPFDHQTGKERMWYSERENKPYHSPGYDLYGERLRPITSKDVEKHQKKMFAAQLEKAEWVFILKQNPTLYIPVKPLKRTKTKFFAQYNYPGGQRWGEMRGKGSDGKNYWGRWKDRSGSGKFHARFVKPTQAQGKITIRNQNIYFVLVMKE